MSDIKNVNAKHKNNKVNTVSIFASDILQFNLLTPWNSSNNKCFQIFFLDTAELHVYYVERQQSHCCQDISRRDDWTLQKEYLVGLAGSYWFSICRGAAVLTSLKACSAKCNAGGSDFNVFNLFVFQWGCILWYRIYLGRNSLAWCFRVIEVEYLMF